ncbi:MAG: hypothetical protein JSR33_04910 [Proteobacteria bacterium]|nr:hypothetical protein [Pseudomonadota bacterium]
MSRPESPDVKVLVPEGIISTSSLAKKKEVRGEEQKISNPIRVSTHSVFMQTTASVPMSVDNLLALDESPVLGLVKSEFRKQLENASSVRGVFFPSAPTCLPPKNPDFINHLATAILCRSISHSSLHGFSKTVNYAKADRYVIAMLEGDDAFQSGKYIYDQLFPIACAADGHTFQEYLQSQTPSKIEWATQFAKHISSDAYINVEITKIIADPTGAWQYRLNVILHKLELLDPSRKPAVLKKWQAAYPQIQDLWETYRRIVPEDMNGDQFLAEVNVALSEEASHSETYTRGGSAAMASVITYVTYGKKVEQFLKENRDKFVFITRTGPDNQKTISPGKAFGCFTEDTPVLLADGSSVPISQIRHKDPVVGLNGVVALHTDEKVVQELKKDTVIYGFNEDAPFFTAGHPFLTSGGWKAIDISASLEENPELEISELKVGDMVCKFKSTDPLIYEEIKISGFSEAILPTSYKVYGLHLQDGPASYHANGYCVRMNYPMITEKRLIDGFSRLSFAEKRLLSNYLMPVMPLLTKAMGKFVEAPLTRSLALKPPASSTLPQPKKEVRSSLSLSAMTDRDYELKVFDHKTGSHSDHKELVHLSLRKGKFIVNDKIIVSPKLVGNSMTWAQKTKDHYMAGYIIFTTDRLAFCGTISLGSDEKLARSFEVAGVVPPSVYTSTLQGPDGKPIGDGAGLSIRLSYRCDPHTPVPVSIIDISNDGQKTWTNISGSDPDSPSLMVTLSLSPKTGNLVMNFPFMADGSEQDYYSFYKNLWPAQGSIEFSSLGNTFDGTMQPYDSSSEQPSAVVYTWKGTFTGGVTKAPLINRMELVLSSLPSPPLLSSKELTLGNLIAIMPNTNEVQSMSNQMLQENMKWAIGQMDNGWLSDFFGVIPPTLSDERKELVKKSLDFYQEKFAVAYLGWSIGQMTGLGAPTTPLSPTETNKLKYYLTNGLAHESDYSIQTMGIFPQAYRAASTGSIALPSLDDYLEDKTPDQEGTVKGEKWAKLLYNQGLTTPQQINILAAKMSAFPQEAMTIINQNAALLSVLQPHCADSQKKSYSNQYMQFLLNEGLFHQVKGVIPPYSSEMKQEVDKWVPDFIKAFIEKYINSSGGDPGTIRLRAMAEELQEAIDKLGGFIELANSFSILLAYVMQKSKGRTVFNNDTLTEMEEKFRTNNPKYAMVLKFVKYIGVAFSLFSVYTGFTNWKNISGAQRTTVILTTLNLLEPVVDILVDAGKWTLNTLAKIKAYFRPPTPTIDVHSSDFLDWDEAEVRTSFKALFQEGEEGVSIILRGTRLLLSFGEGLAKVVLKAMGPFMAAAFAGIEAYNFAEDLIQGKPIEKTIFDGIILTAGMGLLACALIEALEIGVLMEVAAVGGPLFVVVGIVFGLVEAFLPKDHPESPVDVFMKKFRSFLNQQKDPPTDWKPLTEKAVHLSQRMRVTDNKLIGTRRSLEEKQGLSSYGLLGPSRRDISRVTPSFVTSHLPSLSSSSGSFLQSTSSQRFIPSPQPQLGTSATVIASSEVEKNTSQQTPSPSGLIK